MNILFIAIHHYQIYFTLDGKPLSKKGFLPVHSLTLMQLAALTPDKYNITALDNPIKIDFNCNYDLIVDEDVNFCPKCGLKFIKNEEVDEI